MTKDQAIEIAAAFAKRQGVSIGEALTVLYDPIIRLDYLWEPAFEAIPAAKRPKQWTILFDIPDTPLDPGTVAIGVNDETGRVRFLHD